jgi:hypothetical protein
MDEVIEDSLGEVFASIIEQYAKTPSDDSSDSSDEEEQEDVAPV